MMNTTLTSKLLLCWAGLLLAGCGGEVQERADAASDLRSYLLTAEPSGAISVGEARRSSQPGAAIVVSGRIGAALEPFSESYATFVLGDEALMYCDEMPDDHCETPWDACCEDPDKVRASRASVQIVSGGVPLAGTLRGVGGLEELDPVVVRGEVDPASTRENLIINASGIFRVPHED